MSISSTAAVQSGGYPFAVDTEPMVQARLKALPQSAQAKHEHLRRVALRARAMADGHYEQITGVSEARGDAQRELGRFDRLHQPEAAFTYEDDPKTGTRKRVPAEFPERVAILARIDAATTELKRLQAEQAAIRPGFSLDDLDRWLIDQPPSIKFVDARVSPKLAKSETLAAALERNREAQARMTDELSRVRGAPRTTTEAKALMRQQVAAMAEKGRPDVTALFRGGDIAWPTEQLVARAYGATEVAISTTVKNASALAVWAHRDAIIAALDAEIDRLGNDTEALSATEQASRIAECEHALLSLQREAEALIERLEGDGVAVQRTCVDPLVLLGIGRARQ